MRTLAIALFTVAACGGGGGTDIDPTLRFADRSDIEISRFINAAAGTDMFMAQNAMDQFGDTFDNDPCPQIAISGNTATVTGGCTRLDGTTITGEAIVTNPLGWDQIEEFDYNSGTTYQANQLVIADESWTQTFDGIIRRTDMFTVWDADITVTMWDLTLRSDLYYACSNPNAPRCQLSGSGIELPGVGGALASGLLTADPDTGRQTADFTLEGVDTLTVHTDGQCVEWSISGTDRGMDCP